MTCVTVIFEHLNAPVLEHLQFWFPVDEESLGLPPHSERASVTAAMAKPCFSRLKRLLFGLPPRSEWARIKAAMAKPCFSRLKMLLFEVEGHSNDRKRVIEHIRLHLSAYNERGILTFAESSGFTSRLDRELLIDRHLY
jgi:hypothetical protein